MADRDRAVRRSIRDEYFGRPGRGRAYLNRGKSRRTAVRTEPPGYRQFRGPASQPPIGATLRKPEAAQSHKLARAQPIVLRGHVGFGLLQPIDGHDASSHRGFNHSEQFGIYWPQSYGPIAAHLDKAVAGRVDDLGVKAGGIEVTGDHREEWSLCSSRILAHRYMVDL